MENFKQFEELKKEIELIDNLKKSGIEIIEKESLIEKIYGWLK